MSRVSVADRAKLSWLVALRARAAARRRSAQRPSAAAPGASCRSGPSGCLIAPQDLRTADATRASEIYSGRFAFAGKVVVCDGRSVFEMEPPSDEWATALLGFGWLRHLRAAESAITRANARALVDEWIALAGLLASASAWRPDVLARRDHLLAQPVDAGAAGRRRALLSPLPAQPAAAGPLSAPHRGRRAPRRRRACRPRSRSPMPRCASPARRATSSRATRAARRASSNGRSCPTAAMSAAIPAAIIELLLELLPLRQAFASRNIAPPPALLNAIDRMMPMLRFFRHSEGTLRAFQRHGHDAGRRAADAPRL